MSRNNTFWDILSEISSEIPKFSTDFITPDGINYKKMIETVKNANFNEMLPMWTLGTDLAMTLLKNAPKTSKMVGFVEFARNSLALYSILDDIHTNIVPSNAMENRNEIGFWKGIGNKFNINIPICDHYSTRDAGPIPLSDILMYLIAKMKDKEIISRISDDGKFKIIVQKIGMTGTEPIMTAGGNIIAYDNNIALLRCKCTNLDETVVHVDAYYTIAMNKIDNKDFGKGRHHSMQLDDDDDDDDSAPQISGDKLLNEHTAYLIGNPEDSETAKYHAIELALMMIYAKLDVTKFHFFVDFNKLSIHNNNELLCKDEDSWVRSPILDRISQECERVSDFNMTRSYAFVGPPGTGKTTTCEHLMLEMANNGYTIIRCSLANRYLHSTLSRILLAVTMSLKSVILFDDLDSLDISYKSNEVQELIDFFDRLQKSNVPSVVFSTVNNPRNVHSTVMGRSGRIDEVVTVNYPDATMIAELLRKYSATNKYSLAEDDIKVASETLEREQVSVADIKNLATMMIVKHGIKETYSLDELNTGVEALVSSRNASRINFCYDDQD